MISLFAAMHALAAQRGEGLHPQLVNLLKNAKPALPPRAEPRSHVAPAEADPQMHHFGSRPKRKQTVNLDRHAEATSFARSADGD